MTVVPTSRHGAEWPLLAKDHFGEHVLRGWTPQRRSFRPTHKQAHTSPPGSMSKHKIGPLLFPTITVSIGERPSLMGNTLQEHALITRACPISTISFLHGRATEGSRGSCSPACAPDREAELHNLTLLSEIPRPRTATSRSPCHQSLARKATKPRPRRSRPRYSGELLPDAT